MYLGVRVMRVKSPGGENFVRNLLFLGAETRSAWCSFEGRRRWVATRERGQVKTRTCAQAWGQPARGHTTRLCARDDGRTPLRREDTRNNVTLCVARSWMSETVEEGRDFRRFSFVAQLSCINRKWIPSVSQSWRVSVNMHFSFSRSHFLRC